jgi:hypothetical protein
MTLSRSSTTESSPRTARFRTSPRLCRYDSLVKNPDSKRTDVEQLNLYFAWASQADDKFWYNEMRGSLDRLKAVAAAEGIYDDSLTQYPNYALFDATGAELYGRANAKRLRKIRDAVDPQRVMDLAAGFVI